MDLEGIIILVVFSVTLTATVIWVMQKIREDTNQPLPLKTIAFFAFFVVAKIAPLAWAVYETSGNKRYYKVLWIRFIENSLSWIDIGYVSIGPVAIACLVIKYYREK